MKIIIAIASIVCAFVCIQQISALPFGGTDVENLVALDATEPGHDAGVAIIGVPNPSREKRATCDLLSFTGVNHAACAAGCIARGFRGGHCNGNAVCVCRH